jgi:hypothetical protein
MIRIPQSVMKRYSISGKRQKVFHEDKFYFSFKTEYTAFKDGEVLGKSFSKLAAIKIAREHAAKELTCRQ